VRSTIVMNPSSSWDLPTEPISVIDLDEVPRPLVG